MIITPPPAPCPHCRTMTPGGFLFCRACWKALPFIHKARLWTDQARAHHPDIYPEGPHWLNQSMAAAKTHLAQL